MVAISAGPMVMLRVGATVYSPSKFAVDQLVHVLAPEIEHHGIAVNSLMFGAVLTPALTNAGGGHRGRGSKNTVCPRS
jgi:NAD(P)-dependent dehydrogenase (short-subunit alcohol dehydrogenase family)